MDTSPSQSGTTRIAHLDSKSKKIGKYMMMGTIGKGRFKVKRAIDIQNQSVVAIKLFKKPLLDSQIQYDQEKDAYNSFCHQNILKMIESVEEFKYQNTKGELNNYNALVLEYAARGDLFTFVQGHEAFEEKYIRYILKQLLSAIVHVHENGFAHLDIKLENVYLTQQYILKLADFGLSKQMQKDAFEPKKIGSRGYMAPEILENKPFFGEQVDVFALGVLLYSLRAKELPFGQARLNDCWYRLIGNQEYEQFWMYHERKNGIKFGIELKQLLNSMFSYETEQRPTLEQITASQFMQGDTCSDQEFFEEMEKRSQKNQLQLVDTLSK